jgi:hypothetical protein
LRMSPTGVANITRSAGCSPATSIIFNPQCLFEHFRLVNAGNA